MGPSIIVYPLMPVPAWCHSDAGHNEILHLVIDWSRSVLVFSPPPVFCFGCELSFQPGECCTRLDKVQVATPSTLRFNLEHGLKPWDLFWKRSSRNNQLIAIMNILQTDATSTIKNFGGAKYRRQVKNWARIVYRCLVFWATEFHVRC